MQMLAQLFEAQDDAASHHRADPAIEKRLDLLSEMVQGVQALLSRRVPSDDLQSVLLAFASDAASAVVAAARLALWGLTPESAAQLRSVYESVAILSVVVQERSYATVLAELRTGKLRTFAFDSAVKRLPNKLSPHFLKHWG